MRASSASHVRRLSSQARAPAMTRFVTRPDRVEAEVVVALAEVRGERALEEHATVQPALERGPLRVGLGGERPGERLVDVPITCRDAPCTAPALLLQGSRCALVGRRLAAAQAEAAWCVEF